MGDSKSKIHTKAGDINMDITYKDVPWKDILWTGYTLYFIGTGLILVTLIILEETKIIPENIDNQFLSNMLDAAFVVAIISMVFYLGTIIYHIVLKLFFKNKLYNEEEDSDDDV